MSVGERRRLLVLVLGVPALLPARTPNGVALLLLAGTLTRFRDNLLLCCFGCRDPELLGVEPWTAPS